MFLTLKKKVKGNLKKYLILTSASALGFFISILLHNIFYGLGIMAKYITLLSYILEALHVIFFLIATIICPIGFLIGTIGSIILFHKEKK